MAKLTKIKKETKGRYLILGVLTAIFSVVGAFGLSIAWGAWSSPTSTPTDDMPPGPVWLQEGATYDYQAGDIKIRKGAFGTYDPDPTIFLTTPSAYVKELFLGADGMIYDKDDNSGATGQILMSVGEDGIDWVDPSLVASDEDWVIDGDNIYHVDGNVGIGTLTPTARLDIGNDPLVVGLIEAGSDVNVTGAYSTAFGSDLNVSGFHATAFGQGIDVTGDHSYAFGHGINVSGMGSFGIGLSDTDLGVTVSQSNTMAVMGGSLGIGTASPDKELDVVGDVEISGRLYDSSGDAGSEGQVLSSTSTGTNWIDAPSGGTGTGTADTDWTEEDGNVYRDSGNVGINNPSPVFHLDIISKATTAIANIFDYLGDLWTGIRLARGGSGSGAEKWFIGMGDDNDDLKIRQNSSENVVQIANSGSQAQVKINETSGDVGLTNPGLSIGDSTTTDQLCLNGACITTWEAGGIEPGPTCGNGILEVGEQCDCGDGSLACDQSSGAFIGPPSCVSFGYAGGELNCNACYVDSTDCYGGGGDTRYVFLTGNSTDGYGIADSSLNISGETQGDIWVELDSGATVHGVEAADMICDNLAQNSSVIPVEHKPLGGGKRYRAWLGATINGSEYSPGLSWYHSNDFAYFLTNGSIIANDGWDDLLDGSILNEISVDENGTIISGSLVWSAASGADGRVLPERTCLSWENNESSEFGYNGYSVRDDYGWAQGGSNVCNSFYRLYCFEQF